MNITDEMFETMMYMIGYGCLENNFTDAVDSCDHDSLLELAGWCENRWMTEGQLTDPLRRAIERYNKEEYE
jgi:hypothetical protein|tara:strand:+ start:134 stop:346 length:213 start_codon:yes stop_codon:yes gene_type:complete